MSNIVTVPDIKSMTEEQKKLSREAEELILQQPQIYLETWHTLHAGVYTRTIVLKKGQILVNTDIKISTNLIINGHIRIYSGDDIIDYQGVVSLTASNSRKQVMTALENTTLCMYFATKATTIQEAEEEFTDEAEKLMSRLPSSTNYITITGE